MSSSKKLFAIMFMVMFLMATAACSLSRTPETITVVETVVVEKEVEKEVVKEVEKVVTVEVEKIVEVEVPAAEEPQPEATEEAVEEEADPTPTMTPTAETSDNGTDTVIQTETPETQISYDDKYEGDGWINVAESDLPDTSELDPNDYPGWTRMANSQQSDRIERDVEITVQTEQIVIISGDSANIPGIGQVGGENACYLAIAEGPVVWDSQPGKGEFPLIHWDLASAWDLHDKEDSADVMVWAAQKARALRKSYPATCGKGIDVHILVGGLTATSGQTAAVATPVPSVSDTGWKMIQETMGINHDPAYVGHDGLVREYALNSSEPFSALAGEMLMQFGTETTVAGQYSLGGGEGGCYVLVAEGPVSFHANNGSDGKGEIHLANADADPLAWAEKKLYDACPDGGDILVYNQ